MGYPDFKAYIQDKHCRLLQDEIAAYVRGYHDGIGFHSYSVLSVCEEIVENVEVHSVVCHEGLGDLIKMDVNVAADIITKGLGKKSYEADRKRRLFIVHLSGELHNGLHDVRSTGTEEYHNYAFEPEGALDAYLIPYISTDQLEKIAEDFFEVYCFDAVYTGYMLPVDHIMRELKMCIYEAPLPDNVFGRVYFREAQGKRYIKFHPRMPETEVATKISPGTIVINRKHFFLGSVGSPLNTIAHELIHWELHQRFFELLALLSEDSDALSCNTDPPLFDSQLNGLQKAIWWAEWQANSLAPRILMPCRLFTSVFMQVYAEKRETTVYHCSAEIMEKTIECLAELFGVSKLSAKIRAIQLGITEAEGVCLHIDGIYHPPFTFRRGSLAPKKTFILDRINYDQLMIENAEFFELINSGQFVYTGCVVCINDPLYIRKSHFSQQSEFELTIYARENVNECCLAFDRIFYQDDSLDKDFYGLCYLSKELNAASHTKTTPTDDLQNQDRKSRAVEAKKLREKGDSIMAVLRSLPTGFPETLDTHIRMARKSNGRKMTNLELSKITGLSEDYIASLRKDPGLNVTLETVCSLCIALHLLPCYSKDLIRKSRNEFPQTGAGYLMLALIEEHYTDSLDAINEVLRDEGLRDWGKSVV